MKNKVLMIVFFLLSQIVLVNAHSDIGSDVGKGSNGKTKLDFLSNPIVDVNFNEDSKSKPKDKIYRTEMVNGHHDYHGICYSVIAILQEAYNQALWQFRKGHLQGSRDTLMQGLISSHTKFSELQNKPFTQNAIQRGLKIDEVFQNSCRNNDQSCLNLETRVALYFLSSYYKYIIHKVYVLDTHYFINYLTNYHSNCHNFDCLPEDQFGSDFFINYKEAAVALLAFYNGENSEIPQALAKDTYELGLAERIFLWVSEDLDSDLFRRQFSCAIKNLKEAYQLLNNFNLGVDVPQFSSSRHAVDYARFVSSHVGRFLKNHNDYLRNDSFCHIINIIDHEFNLINEENQNE